MSEYLESSKLAVEQRAEEHCGNDATSKSSKCATQTVQWTTGPMPLPSWPVLRYHAQKDGPTKSIVRPNLRT
eukprot:3737566-Amphidinium_carterae.1